MAREGHETSLYLQKDLLQKINNALKKYPDSYKSRNGFINGAIVRELRRLGFVPSEETQAYEPDNKNEYKESD